MVRVRKGYWTWCSFEVIKKQNRIEQNITYTDHNWKKQVQGWTTSYHRYWAEQGPLLRVNREQRKDATWKGEGLLKEEWNLLALIIHVPISQDQQLFKQDQQLILFYIISLCCQHDDDDDDDDDIYDNCIDLTRKELSRSIGVSKKDSIVLVVAVCRVVVVCRVV